MFQNAYALFFLSVLAGCAFALWTLARAHAPEVIAVLRGRSLAMQEPKSWTRSRFVRFRSGRRPAFQQVEFSICRL
ncbi:MAG TPA: hypothetical protein VF628_04040 [Allosphingosinicella sp.]|jgi:hypothetical protein